jgi:hypothetical protein
LIDAGVPKRFCAIDGQHSAVREKRRQFDVNRFAHSGYYLFQITTQCRLSSGVSDHHRIEKPRGVGEAFELRLAS